MSNVTNGKGVIQQHGDGLGIELTWAQLITITDQNRTLYIARPVGPSIVELEKVMEDLVKAGCSTEDGASSSLNLDDLYDTLVRQMNYKVLTGPDYPGSFYLRPPHPDMDKHRTATNYHERIGITLNGSSAIPSEPKSPTSSS